MPGTEKRIMCVGLVCLDLISVVDGYPAEDTDQKCMSQQWQRGGNASNTCTVLSMLGAECEFMGTMSDSHELHFLQADMAKHGVATDHCVIHQGCHCPLAVCMVNHRNGSRTIVSPPRDLPELTFEEFETIDLTTGRYSWIHFEGRYNVEEIKRMLEHITVHNLSAPKESRIITSVELEKTRRDIDILVNLADYVFVGKDHAKLHGCDTKHKAVDIFVKKIRKGATVICPWGDSGVAARSADGQHQCDVAVYPLDKVVDTLGAGDTFIAGTIWSLNAGKSLEKSVDAGNRLAGAKCGMKGFQGLSVGHASDTDDTILEIEIEEP